MDKLIGDDIRESRSSPESRRSGDASSKRVTLNPRRLSDCQYQVNLYSSCFSQRGSYSLEGLLLLQFVNLTCSAINGLSLRHCLGTVELSRVRFEGSALRKESHLRIRVRMSIAGNNSLGATSIQVNASIVIVSEDKTTTVDPITRMLSCLHNHLLIGYLPLRLFLPANIYGSSNGCVFWWLARTRHQSAISFRAYR